MEHLLPRKEYEIADAWVARFYEKYERFPKTEFFRYAPPKEYQRFGSKSPKSGHVGSGHLPSSVSSNLANVKNQSSGDSPKAKKKNPKGISV